MNERLSYPGPRLPGPATSPEDQLSVVTHRTLGTGGSVGAVSGLLDDAFAAVLLIDLDAGLVTYANRAAVRLAGDVSLPVSMSSWSEAAGLRSLGGSPLEETANPLARLAAGTPVAGEPVTVRPDEAGGVPSPEGYLFWVTGFPLSASPQLERLALVVLLELDADHPLSPGRAGAREAPGLELDAVASLRDRAVLATDLSFTITDPHQPGNPLVWVNEAFTAVTGYSFDDSVGRNCKFLQGPDTDPEVVGAISKALRESRGITVTLLNYRADGTPFWNELSISPVLDTQGQVANFVGIQADVTARVAAEAERERMHALERQARVEVQRAHDDLALLASVTTSLTSTLDVDKAMGLLADLLVPEICDWCVVDLLETDSRRQRVVARHRDSNLSATVEVLAERYGRNATASSGRQQVLADGKPKLRAHVTADDYLPATTDPALQAAFAQAGAASAMYVPLTARNKVLGVVTLVRTEPGRPYTTQNLAVAADIGLRAAVIFDNAHLYEQEHRTAELLQRSLLPKLPVVPGLHLAARYLTGSVGASVGGDWYDVLPLRDGSTGITIGDVMGHDLAAAAAMGQLRGMIRSYAWNEPHPGRVLAHLDSLVQALEVAELATIFHARLEPAADNGAAGSRAEASTARLVYSNAGHHPPLLADPDGMVTVLDGAAGALIGILPGDQERPVHTAPVAPGSLLVLFTDGLIEQRGVSLQERADRLAASLSRHADQADLERLCDLLLADMSDRPLEDDVALLLVRVL